MPCKLGNVCVPEHQNLVPTTHDYNFGFVLKNALPCAFHFPYCILSVQSSCVSFITRQLSINKSHVLSYNLLVKTSFLHTLLYWKAVDVNTT